MRTFIIAVLVLNSVILKGQTVQSSCQAADSIIKKFRSDAERMAIYRVSFKINSPYTDSIHIDPALRKKYLDALVAVYNATTIPARDSVIDKYHIHRLWEPLNQIIIDADSNLTWMKNFKNNVYPVGNAVVDSLRAKHYLAKQFYNNLGSSFAYHELTLFTDTNCNTFSLCNFLSSHVSGISLCTPNFSTGLNTDIKDSVNNNFIELTYKYGWGDCMSGCINNRYWKFRAFNDCSVLYEGSFGTPLGIQENQSPEDPINIYPNPATDFVTIEAAGSNFVEIVNAFSQVIDSAVGEKLVLSISDIPSGIYFVRVRYQNRAKVLKLNKP